MKVKDLIKELEKLPQDANIGVWNEYYYEIQEPIIKNVDKDKTHLNNQYKRKLCIFYRQYIWLNLSKR